mmetsp:Transcript_80080/g.210308  ORF Transcript_80080/g.210308 Transcript_80080/m.210308 type:complete len:281 (-) Transcript_80080:74-916(-)
MQNVNAQKKLAEVELENGLEGNRSWHHRYKDSAYIYIGGLHAGLTEGDVAICFSQFGELIDINLVRDQATGKSKGFCFICYEDQRSTVLAVDNLNGYQMLNKTLRVDHIEKYKAPKRLDEENLDENGDPTLLTYDATGAEGKGYQVYNVVDGQKKIDEALAQRRKPKASLAMEDDDDAWAKSFEEGLKKTKATEAEKKKLKKLKKEKKEIKEMKKEAKRLKKETKKAKKEAKKAKQAKKGKQGGSDSSDSSSSSSSGSSSLSLSLSEDSSASEKPKKRRK